MSEDRGSHAVHIQRIEDALLIESTLRGIPSVTGPLSERMAIYGVPGVSVAVIDDGELAWARGYGRIDATGETLVTDRTIFQAASISKPVTAVAVMRLVQEGRIDLDEDVNVYLQSWKVPANASWQPRLTLRHLLSHSGGTTVGGFPGYRPGSMLPTTVQVLNGSPPANTPPVRVSGIPGLQRRYSGGGTTIVQQVLVDLLGGPFPDLMHNLVLEPLGMEDSTYRQPLPEDRVSNAARGHRTASDPISARWADYPEMAAAGLWTTPTDLARLARELQRARAEQGGRILSTSSVEQMLTPWFGSGCGLGFFLDGEGSTLRFRHGGANEGFRCALWAYADRGAGVVVMTNGDMGDALVPEIIGALVQEYRWPLGVGDIAGTFRPAWPPTPIDNTELAPYTGEYELDLRPDYRIQLTASEGTLTLHLPDQPAMALVRFAPGAFAAAALDIELQVVQDDAGAVTHLTITQDEETTLFRRTG